ncbi:aquaporin [Tahibacter harae]|uniref:aquaporin n=1 Tax=Tahibacter harae TaxID=2963937 RepID=UPI00272E6ECD|nr:aquaporin [Tahibacter harae]
MHTQPSLARRGAAEALGSALLAATVIGSGIMAERLAGGNLAVALLANTAATVAVLVVLIALLGPVSGAHFNPLVSAVAVLRRRLAIGDSAVYIALQAAGCCAGAVLAHAMFELPLLQTSAHVRTGPAQWLAEAVASFGLLSVVIGHRRSADAPWLVAAWIGAAYWFTASTSFANPAITLARCLTDTFAGIRPADVPGFVLAQCAGAALGLGLGGWLFAPARAPERR